MSSKGQITIPVWARKRLGIGPGDKVALRIDDGKLLVEHVDEPLRRLRGALRGVYGEDPDRSLQELRREWERQTPA